MVSHPPGYLSSVSLTRRQAGNQNNEAAFHRKAMSIAKSPLGGLGMRAFMLWMIGNNLHLFSIIAVGTALFQPLKAIATTSSAFESLSHGGVDLTMPKLVYIAIHMLGLGMGLYKLGTMGLLPVTSADWHHMVPIPSFLESSAGGL